MRDIQEQIDLSELTTIKTGGKARFLIECEHERDLVDALQFAQNNGLRVLVLGGGSNSLISDRGFNGLVLHLVGRGITVSGNGRVTVNAGEPWDAFVLAMCEKGLTGVEALSGIPGLVGATPVQNVGAYGQEVSQTIESVRAINRVTLKTQVFSPEECGFGYRDSRFKSLEKNQWIISEVTFQLSPVGEPSPRYEELRRALSADEGWNSGDRQKKIMAIRTQVLRIRTAKGMVLNPSDTDTYSLGSFFVNPIVTEKEKDWVMSAAKTRGLSGELPAHPAGDNLWKLSAAWLIENSGVNKGFAMGRARISTKHVLAITNPNRASTAEVLALADFVKESVFSAFGIQLVQEPEYIE